MSLRFALLGLVALRPMSGYEIKSTFDRSIFYIWNVTGAQIYNTLKQLRDDGLVDSEHVVQVGKPDKQVHTITERGREALAAGASAPFDPEVCRDTTLLRIFFGNFAEPAALEREVGAYLQRIRADRAFLEEVHRRVMAHPGHNHEARRYQLLSLRLKAAQLRATEDELTASGFGTCESEPVDLPERTAVARAVGD
jgi:PadR family transcriptional regulator, regulatory protein AphA